MLDLQIPLEVTLGEAESPIEQRLSTSASFDSPLSALWFRVKRCEFFDLHLRASCLALQGMASLFDFHSPAQDWQEHAWVCVD